MNTEFNMPASHLKEEMNKAVPAETQSGISVTTFPSMALLPYRTCWITNVNYHNYIHKNCSLNCYISLLLQQPELKHINDRHI